MPLVSNVALHKLLVTSSTCYRHRVVITHGRRHEQQLVSTSMVSNKGFPQDQRIVELEIDSDGTRDNSIFGIKISS